MSGNDFALGDANGDGKPDLLAADNASIHLRHGDGRAGFGDEFDVPFRAGRSGAITFADLDDAGLSDAALVVAPSTIDVMRSDGNTFRFVTTLSLAANERAIGVLAGWFRSQTSGPRDLAVLVATPTQHVLRVYPGHVGAQYVANEALEHVDDPKNGPGFASLGDPVIWAVAGSNCDGGGLGVDLRVGMRSRRRTRCRSS